MQMKRKDIVSLCANGLLPSYILALCEFRCSRHWYLDLSVCWCQGEAELFRMLLWCVWRARNLFVFQEKEMQLSVGLHLVLRTMGECQNTCNISATKAHESVDKWIPPDVDHLKLSTDTTIRDNEIGFGTIVRNHDGLVVLTTTKLIRGVFDPDLAEAMALSVGITAALEANLHILIAESVCFSLMQDLKSKHFSPSYMGETLNDIISLCAAFLSVTFNHCRREANTAAHNLASFACLFHISGRWLGCVPPNFYFYVSLDAVSV